MAKNKQIYLPRINKSMEGCFAKSFPSIFAPSMINHNRNEDTQKESAQKRLKSSCLCYISRRLKINLVLSCLSHDHNTFEDTQEL